MAVKELTQTAIKKRGQPKTPFEFHTYGYCALEAVDPATR
jgi:hypothetical protein